MAEQLRTIHPKGPNDSAELGTTQLWKGLFSLRHPGPGSLLLCVAIRSCCSSQALTQNTPRLPQGSVHAETGNSQPILLSVLTTVTDAKGRPTQIQWHQISSSFMFLPLLCKGKTVSGQSQRRKRKQSTPPPGRTSPRWCSCSGWHVHTPRRCQGSPCWSTCPLGVQVSTNTGVVKKRGDKKKKKEGRQPHWMRSA